MNIFFKHLGKLVIGLVAIASDLLLILLIRGFIMQNMRKEYLMDSWRFFTILLFVAVVSSILLWRWRKEILVDVLAQL